MTKKWFAPLLAVASIAFAPVPAAAYDSNAHDNAAMTIAAACMYWQFGQIPRSQIMSTAKSQYRKKYGNPNSIDWNKAIKIAVAVDKAKGLGCLE